MNGLPRRAIMLAVLLLIVGGIVAWTRQGPGPSTDPDSESTRPARPTILPLAMTDPARRPQITTNAIRVPAAGIDQEDDVRRARCAWERRQQWLAHRDRLNMEDVSPDKAMAHAFLTQLLSVVSPDTGHGAVAHEFQTARERWPENVELAWLSMRHCVELSGCERNAEWRHLQALDPDNAVVWMLAMESAMQRKDEVAYEQALRRAVGARSYDPRHGATFLHARRVLLSDPMPASCQDPGFAADLQKTLGRPPHPIDWANVHAHAMEVAFAAPGIGGLSGCNPNKRALSPSRRHDCRTLLSRIAQGDTMFEQIFAMSLLVRLVGNGPDHAQLRERYRHLRWLMSVMPRLELPDDFTTRMWTDGEVTMLQALAMAQGFWPPPPRWLPADAHSRALIQTGRVPPQRRHDVPRRSPRAS